MADDNDDDNNNNEDDNNNFDDGNTNNRHIVIKTDKFRKEIPTHRPTYLPTYLGRGALLIHVSYEGHIHSHTYIGR